MTARAGDLTPEAHASLDKSVRLYCEMGFSAERIAALLIRSGYPAAAVQQRFPDVPLSELPAAPVRRKLGTRSGSDRSMLGSASGRTGGAAAAADGSSLIGRAGGSLDAVLGRLGSGSDRIGSGSSSRSPGAHRVAAVELDSNRGDAQARGTAADLEGMSFQYVPLIQCSFPHGDPGEQTLFTRRNGWLEVTLSTTRPHTGLPYGVPARLLTIYCTSEAIRTRSPEIDLGKSVHDFLRRLDIPISRGERGSLRVYANQLLRLVHCAISIDEDIRDACGRQGLHIRQSLFVDEARLWWDEAEGVGRGSSLILSPVLYQSILERSAPLSTAAIRQLRKSPMDLDVYAWLVHRLFHLSKPSSLSWEQLSGQIGHSYEEPRHFRRFFADSLRRVLRVYPEAKVSLSEKGILLLPSRPHIERRALSGT